ncbi:MAG: Mur ligase domain-containing protein [Acidobacteria bacterium]|nr:Mur ligase domain-containing protein [Acidobacteriota bacterium]
MADPDLSGLTEDSRHITTGMLFVAVPGTALDGHSYIPDALARGAAAVVAERFVESPSVPFLQVPSARRALASMAARFYGEPARSLDIVGFTGTFGKTSTSDILRQLLAADGARPGVLGSLGARFGAFYDPGNGLTTPAPVELHRALRGLKDAGASAAIMEVTSHALRMGRVDGLCFAGGLIAAIMPGEHTDFHRTYDDYLAAKRLFLDYLRADALLAYDADNPAAKALADGARVRRRIGFSLDGNLADICFTDVVMHAHGSTFDVGGQKLHSALLGRGHLRNVALAATYALGAGVSMDAVRTVLRTLKPLRRRMETYTAGGRTVLDDTAAHPDSFRAAFDVAALIPHKRIALVYAIRGNRGADINDRNARAIADLTRQVAVDTLIVTAASDCTGHADQAHEDEIAATRAALSADGRSYLWHDSLGDALADAASRTARDDLVMLLGAQGMNEGKRLLEEKLIAES